MQTNKINQYKKYKTQLKNYIEQYTFEGKIPKAIEKAFHETPRHLYVKKFQGLKNGAWHTVDSNNLQEHLSMLYKNAPLVLVADEKGVHSTISQPSFVLQMIDLLQLETGDKVLEIGAASGWNAALIGNIVGSEGHVFSIEIISELVNVAQQNILENEVDNVSIIEGDGGAGWLPNAPYDKIAFTAGAYDIPKSLYAQLKEGGLLLMVLKLKGGGDTLLVLKKEKGVLSSIHNQSCSFVPLTGKYQNQDFISKPLKECSYFKEIEQKVVHEKSFWWGYKEPSDKIFMWKMLGFRTYLSIVEPLFETYTIESNGKNYDCFGIWDESHQSLVLASRNKIIAYNNMSAFDLLWQHIQNWVALGMIDVSCLNVKVYPVDREVEIKSNEWKTVRKESQFVWSLKA